MPCFLAVVERKPRTLWACRATAFMISAKVAPFARPIISSILVPLVSARGEVALRSGLVAFLLALAVFFGLPALAALWPLCAPCSATVADFSVASTFVIIGFPFLRFFLRMTIHHSVPPETQGKCAASARRLN